MNAIREETTPETDKKSSYLGSRKSWYDEIANPEEGGRQSYYLKASALTQKVAIQEEASSESEQDESNLVQESSSDSEQDN